MADNRTGAIIKTKSGEFVTTQLSDGTEILLINADGSINSVVTATALDIRALSSATDSIAVSATDLDVRDLAFATDKVDVSGSSVTVSATDLDIRALAFATDTVDVSGSSVTVSATDLDIRALDSAQDSVTVVASDLDVRDLTHASDSVKVGDGTDFLAVNGDGSINVVVQSTAATPVFDYEKQTNVASETAGNFDYIVTDTKAFTGKFIKVGSAGFVKVEVGEWNGVDTFTIKETFFQQPGFNADHAVSHIKLTGDGTKAIRVAVTNLEADARDLYVTLVGEEL
jgi:hypothetical protein